MEPVGICRINLSSHNNELLFGQSFGKHTLRRKPTTKIETLTQNKLFFPTFCTLLMNNSFDVIDKLGKVG